MGHASRAASRLPAADRLSVPLWTAGLGAATALLLALATASQTYLSMRSHGHSFGRILLWQLGCWGFWALAAPVVIRGSATQPLPMMAVVGGVLTIAHSALASALALWVQPHMPIVSRSFFQLLQNLWWFPLLVDPLVYALLVVGGRTLRAFEQTRQLVVRESQLEAQLVRAHLDALRLEIQPHFLFNTLNSIAALIRQERNEAALAALIELGDLMRASLKEPVTHTRPLRDEIAFTRRFVDLHRLRFGDRLTITYDVAADCEFDAVPVLVLQPLVENAFKHGLPGRRGDCRLDISAHRDVDGTLRLSVADNGGGFPPSFDWALDEGTGLRNTRKRLESIYGTAARLTVAARGGDGAVVTLVIPVGTGHARPESDQP